MSKVKSGDILKVVWRMEKVAIDFDGKKLSSKEFMRVFTDVIAELTVLLLNLHLQIRSAN